MATSTTYTILNATGGVTRHLLGRHQQLRLPDAVAGLRRQQRVPDPGAAGQCRFAASERHTPNQRAVGYALDQSYATATGDFATVIGALAGLSTAFRTAGA